MPDYAKTMDGIRCLQQLATGTAASAAVLALREGLEVEAVEALLQRLSEAGFVECGETGRYRLAREPSAIQIAAVCAALGAPLRGVDPGLTLADLLDWESEVFSDEAVALGA